MRLTRYHEKIDYISNAVASFPYPPKNDIEKHALYYQIITSIEAIGYIISMIVKDKGITVKDDLSNIQTLVERQYIEKQLAERIRRANGLRNILIHRYNAVDDQIVLESVKEIKEMIHDFLYYLERILDEIVKIRNDLKFLSRFEVVLFGSFVEGTTGPKSDIDIAIVTRIQRTHEEKLKTIYNSVIGQANPLYDLRVFELLPLYIQINIINQHLVLFGDPLEISEYFYVFRKLWANCEHRIKENQFHSVKEHLEYIAKQ